MFKTVANRVAHNTTIPGLAGNSDLRPLQDLITSEKTLIIALQKLSSDYAKAAEALRTWGQAEGDDLGDILSASTALLAQFSSAVTQYAGHGHVIREHLKAIRSREEALDELRRRRRTVARKADDAEKKLHKMGPEHKHLDTQTELLHRLQDEIRTLDSDIMTEEASLGDFKRSSTRSWLGFKFGGLLECCEKGVIVGEYGKGLVSEIPEDTTQPGMPRTMYYGHSKINALVNEATRRVNEVAFADSRPPLPLPPKEPGLDSPMTPVGFPNFPAHGQYPPTINTLPNTSRTPAVEVSTPVDDFGAMRAEPNSARFATFPVKLRQDSLPSTNPPTFLSPISSQSPPSLLTTRDDIGDSLSLSIAEALDGKKDTIGEEGAKAWRSELSAPPSAKPTSPPPPGDASTNPWATPPGQHNTLPGHRRDVTSHISDDDDALLAYMTSADADEISDDEGPSKPQPPKVQEPVDETKKSLDANNKAPPPFRPVSVKVEIEDTDAEPHVVKPKKSIPRIPPPTFDPEEDERKHAEKEEKALDAAAARALSQEITLSDFAPPKLTSPTGEKDSVEDGELGRDLAPSLSASQPHGPRAESPLVPPSAPFAQRILSPQPFTDQPPRTAAQAYAQSYQQSSSASSAQSSPTAAQSFAQSYQQGGAYPQQDPPQYGGAPSANLPPRLQAFQPPEPGVPPRFQGTRTGSSPVPPRFQAAHMQPGQNTSPLSYPDGPSPQDNLQHFSGEQSRTSLESPYRTPGELPSSTTSSPRLGNFIVPSGSAPSSPPKSTPASPYQGARLQPGGPVGSAGSSPLASPIPTGARTISASAFKRPQPLPSGSMDSYGSLPDPRRGLPAAAAAPPSQLQLQSGPAQYGGTPVGGVFPGSAPTPHNQLPNTHQTNEPVTYQSQLLPQQQQQPRHPPAHHRISRDLPPPPPGAAAARPETEYDYGFDLSAYEQGSPLSNEFPGGVGQRTSGASARPGSYYGVSAPPQQQQQPQMYAQQVPAGGHYPGYGPPLGQGQQGYGQGSYARYAGPEGGLR